jgi:hypothetical protein
MSHAKVFGPLSILAVGLGVMAAAAATAPTAAAAPAVSIDPVPDLAGALPAPSIPGLDLSISFDGFNLFQSGTADAETGVGTGGFAIASGAGSFASAGFGNSNFFDTAYATGQNSDAEANGGSFDAASANGDNAFAIDTEGSYNSASATGTDSQAFTEDGTFDNAFASGGGVAIVGGDSSSNPSSFDYGSAIGPNTVAEAGGISAPGEDAPSGGDIAMVFDELGTTGSKAFAGNGFGDLATVVGDGDQAFAGLPGSFDFAGIFGDNLGVLSSTGGNFIVGTLPPL